MLTLEEIFIEADPLGTVPAGTVSVMTLDASRRISRANAEMRRALGHGEGDCTGQPLRSCCHPDMPPQVLRDVWATLDDGAVWSAPLKWRRADGTGLWMHTIFAPMRCGETAGSSLVVGLPVLAAQARAAERVYRTMRRHATGAAMACAGDRR